MNKVDYIKTYAPLAIKAGQRFGINPVVILAQSGLESGWGDSYAVRKRNNFFGITAYGSTNEFWNGASDTSTVSGLKFRVYQTPLDSFMDFARLIKSKYPNAYSKSFNIKEYAHEIAYSPYIDEKQGDSRPDYERNVYNNAVTIEKLLAPLLEKEGEKKKKQKIILFSILTIVILIIVFILIKKFKK